VRVAGLPVRSCNSVQLFDQTLDSDGLSAMLVSGIIVPFRMAPSSPSKCAFIEADPAMLASIDGSTTLPALNQDVGGAAAAWPITRS